MVSEVQISPGDPEVRVGGQVTFLPTAYDRAGNICSAATFAWSSNNQAVATVDANGTATGRTAGTAIITAVTGTGAARRNGQATIQVVAAGPSPQPESRPAAETPQPASRPAGPGCAAWERQPEGTGAPAALTVNPLRMQLVRGESQQLRYAAVRDDNSPAQRVCVLFEVDQTGARIASVDSFGMVRAGSDTGQTILRATVAGQRVSVPARTIRIQVQADAIRFRDSTISLSPGTTDTLEVLVPSQNRVINATGMFQFESSNPSVARVGVVRPVIEALAPGVARVTAESDVYPPMTVTVNVHRRVTGLAPTPADSLITIAIGSTRTLAVRATAADSTAVPEAPLRWQRPDGNIVQWDSAAHSVRGLRIGETRVAVSVPAGRDSSLSKVWRIRVVAGGLLASRSRVGVGVNGRTPISVQLLDDQRRPIEEATQLRWTSDNDSIARFDAGQIVSGRVGKARLTATAPWESTTTVEVFVVGDMILSAQRQGRWDLHMVTGTTLSAPVTRDTLLEVEKVAWAPDLTRIAYVASSGPRSSIFDLYLANSDGSEAARITNDSAIVRSPDFVRPAGDQVVYESSRGGRPQIYVLGVGRGASGARSLGGAEYPNTSPAVSPDGRKVVFVSLRETSPGARNYDIYEIGIDGTGERRLTTSPRRDDAPGYSGDGTEIYFLRDEGSGTQRLIRLTLATNTEAGMTPNGVFVRSYSFSADRATAALTTEEPGQGGSVVRRLKLLNVATGALTDFPVPAGEQFVYASYRPATPRPR